MMDTVVDRLVVVAVVVAAAAACLVLSTPYKNQTLALARQCCAS